MENTNNSLAHRQLDVIRKNLLSVFRFAVKALIDKACFCSIDDGCEEFINFCATMEHILQHRLRPSKVWYLGDDRSHFWFYIKAACHQQDLRGCITNIDNIENIKSPVAKGRAFVRCALMEKRLSEYLGEALKQTNITRRFYKPGAIMLGEEATELCGTLLGLNSIDFGFCIKGENYDTVECPLAINYTPFMKFRQSQESLHSDVEEMRELSCGSSLASEDGQDGQDTDHPPTDPWPDRYSLLHKRYMRLLEQKSFLEEVTASQEKALQAAAAAQQEVGRLQRDAAFQKHQYEGVILELQAQVTRMKSIHESLQQQLMSTRGARFPMTEMDRRGERERGGEATRFVAAMGHKLDSDRQSLTSSYDRSSVGKPTGDTRSLASAMSEISVDVVGQGQTTPRPGEDSQSMVPLTGSLGDLHLDLEPGTSELSMVANPEQATPVVSVSSGIYASAFEEINGNGSAQTNIPVSEASLRNMLSVQVSQSEEREGDHATEEAPAFRIPPEDSARTTSAESRQPDQQRGDTTVTNIGHERGETTEAQTLAPAPDPAAQGNENISDHQSESSATSEPEELVAETSSGGEEGGDSQDPEVLSHMTSSKESGALTASDKDDSSEPEVLAQEDENADSENPALEVPNMEASASSDRSDREDASDPEILEEVNTTRKTKEEADVMHAASENVPQGAASGDLPSSDREETSEPEMLTREEASKPDSENPQIGESEHESASSDQNHPSSDASKPDPPPTSKPLLPSQSDRPKSTGKAAASAEEAEKEGGSDSGSSDENKDTWDMLSDANHDSSS